jgi:hypothetical protein
MELIEDPADTPERTALNQDCAAQPKLDSVQNCTDAGR